MKSVHNEIWNKVEVSERIQVGEHVSVEVWNKAYDEIENQVFFQVWQQIYQNIPVDTEA